MQVLGWSRNWVQRQGTESNWGSVLLLYHGQQLEVKAHISNMVQCLRRIWYVCIPHPQESANSVADKCHDH